MISFIMIISIWMGTAPTVFHVYTAQRFYDRHACQVALDHLTNQIRPRLEALKGHPKFRVARGCQEMETRET